MTPAVWCGAAATIAALLCPAWLSERSFVLVAAAHAACMVRTFGLQFGAAMLVVGACAIAARLRRTAAFAGVLAIVWLAPEVWKQVRPLHAVDADGNEALTVMTVNAQFGGCDAQAVAREAAACSADVIVLQEFTGGLAARLDDALAAYPHRVLAPRDDAYGQAIYSRRAFASSEVERGIDGVNDHPRASVVVRLNGTDVRICNVHLVSPISVGRIGEQRLEAAWLASNAAKRPGECELLMVGDFNATADAPIVGAFISSGLVDGWARSSRGRGGTWPATGIASRLGRLRIDNLLSSPGLRCVASGVGGATGSDHLPTWARYVREASREPSTSVDSRGKEAK